MTTGHVKLLSYFIVYNFQYTSLPEKLSVNVLGDD
jgi:hypothetical protein